MLRDKEMWNTIKKEKNYDFLLSKLKNGYDIFCDNKEIPIITFNQELDYLKTGNRLRFEDSYFARRSQLSIYAVYTMLYPENKAYLEKLEDIICVICNEYAWQLPAHRPVDRFNKRNEIDLFAAETGLYLAEIKYMLFDRLNPLVIERITDEIRWRIIDSFENESAGFERVEHNWAAVCGGSVGATFIYESPDGYMKVKHRIEKCMSNYLDGIPDDGSCSEGVDYWIYGFSFYILYNDLLRKHTYGLIDNFKNEKVKKYAEFFTSAFLDNHNAVTFSDAGRSPSYPIWTLHFLKNEYNIQMPPTGIEELYYTKFSWVVRDFTYYKPAYDCNKIETGKSYFDNIGWYVERKQHYGFAAKGGHNAENHNHNDIGSFIVVHGGKTVLCDLGASEYSRQSFGKERYTILNMSSLGHSVPIINGLEQRAGREYEGILTVSQNNVNIDIDMKKAYPIKLNKLNRGFVLKEKEILLTDSFDETIDVTERFVTEIEPKINDGVIRLENTELIFDANIGKVMLKTENIFDHDGKTVRKVYLIDFVIKSGAAEFKLTIRFISQL